MKTGSRPNSETDDDIYMTIVGRPCSYGFMKLDDANRDDFERGRLDTFYFPTTSITSVSHCVVIVCNYV